MITKQNIADVFHKHNTDKGYEHGYYYMYSHVFEKIGIPDNLLEVGIFYGRSIAAWKDLFPSCNVVGLDTKQRDVTPLALLNTLLYHDSTDPTIKDVVGSGYDIIIDDGSHDMTDQWLTFLNLEHCWTKAYVIEDVEGKSLEKNLRHRLRKRGYKNIHTYDSILKNVKLTKRDPERAPFDYCAMVIYK